MKRGSVAYIDETSTVGSGDDDTMFSPEQEAVDNTLTNNIKMRI
jgi:hypothetical protein